MKKNLLALMCMALVITGITACGNNNSKKAKEVSGENEATEQSAPTKGTTADALAGTKWTATETLDLDGDKKGKSEYIVTFSKGGKTQFVLNDYDENGKLDKSMSFKRDGTYAKVAGKDFEWTVKYEDYDEEGHVYLSEDGKELGFVWSMVDESLTKVQ